MKPPFSDECGGDSSEDEAKAELQEIPERLHDDTLAERLQLLKQAAHKIAFYHHGVLVPFLHRGYICTDAEEQR